MKKLCAEAWRAFCVRFQFDVVTADGPGGLAKLDRENFDAVVTDLRMPGVDGFGI